MRIVRCSMSTEYYTTLKIKERMPMLIPPSLNVDSPVPCGSLYFQDKATVVAGNMYLLLLVWVILLRIKYVWGDFVLLQFTAHNKTARHYRKYETQYLSRIRIWKQNHRTTSSKTGETKSKQKLKKIKRPLGEIYKEAEAYLWYCTRRQVWKIIKKSN